MSRVVTFFCFPSPAVHGCLGNIGSLITARLRFLLALVRMVRLMGSLQQKFEAQGYARLTRLRARRAAASRSQRVFTQSPRGFTLIEVMVTVAIVAILAAVALPAYNSYILRSKIPAGLDALSAFQTRMEQRYQDVGNYANATACAIANTSTTNFSVTCALGAGNDPQHFLATATGSGPVAGVVYTVDDQGVRTTVSHPKGVPSTKCWTIRGGSCDS